ncbi:MAG: acyltransferase family protein [Acidimicrobiales bacterium]
MTSTTEIRRLGRVPALDSLRAIAVTLVLLTHVWAVFPFGPFDERWAKSGFLGVDLFFVLSGFLITSLLLEEHHDAGTIRFGRFYLRRAARILPALLLFFAVYLVYSAANDWPPFGRRDFALDSIEATLLYYMNWRVLWNPLGAADLTAIWSLSIEEQFYLVWPVVLLAVLGWTARRGRATWMLLAAAAVLVTVWRAVAFRRWGWEAAYLRTDTRIDGLLWGAVAALLFARGRVPDRLPRWTPAVVGVIWAVLLVWVRADDRSAYFGGIALWVVSAAVLVVHLASRPTAFTVGPVARATRAVGRVSYAAYLWQLPVLRAVERWTPTWPVGLRVAGALVLLAACTWASWLLVERPVLAAKRRLQDRWRSGDAVAADPAPPVSPVGGG